MSWTLGTVRSITLGRDGGKVAIRGLSPVGGPIFYSFHLYADAGVDMIDPTEMVRRNWIISLLQQGLTHGLEVGIEHDQESAFVRQVILHANGPSDEQTSLTDAEITTVGVVQGITVASDVAKVVIKNFGIGFVPGSAPGEWITTEKPLTHTFFLYFDDQLGLIHPKESARRNRLIALLRQAMDSGLDVAVSSVDETNAFVRSIDLRSKG